VTIRTLIVDDEPLARSRIRNLLVAADDIEVAGECENGLEAVEAIGGLHPDLVFLDVQMPGIDGFQVVERIGPSEMPVTVFVTAYDEFALRAFEVHALDYLLKPFEVDRFGQTLERVRRHLELRRRGELEQRLEALLGGLGASSQHMERFLVRVGSRTTFVDVDQVDWIAAEGNYLRLHVGPQSHLVRETIAGVDARLNPRRFLRIHRSTIVNLTRVKAVESVFQGEYVLILKDGTKLNSSTTYRERLEEALLKF
jgi:two-component system, LytTR family, response regulator